MAAPESLRAQILATAAAEPSLTRGRARRMGVVLFAACIAVSVTVFEAIGGLSHSDGRPLPITFAISGGWSIISAGLTWVVLGRGGSTLSRRPVLVLTAALSAPILMFGYIQLFYGTYTEPFARVGYRCLAYTLLLSAGPLAAFFALRRGIEPRSPAVLGAGAGAVCAAWAGALVDLWCPLTDPRHILFGHVLPLGLAVIAGALGGNLYLGLQRVGSRTSGESTLG